LKADFKESEKLAKEHFFNWVKRGNPVPKKESLKENVFTQLLREELEKEKQAKL
jgi:hypothetical protein